MKEKSIIQTAKEELEQEYFRMAVEKEKNKLRNKKTLWQKIMPYKIVIIRR